MSVGGCQSMMKPAAVDERRDLRHHQAREELVPFHSRPLLPFPANAGHRPLIARSVQTSAPTQPYALLLMVLAGKQAARVGNARME